MKTELKWCGKQRVWKILSLIDHGNEICRVDGRIGDEFSLLVAQFVQNAIEKALNLPDEKDMKDRLETCDYIARAVNNFDDLVAALEMVIESPAVRSHLIHERLKFAKDALSRAKVRS